MNIETKYSIGDEVYYIIIWPPFFATIHGPEKIVLVESVVSGKNQETRYMLESADTKSCPLIDEDALFLDILSAIDYLEN